MSLPNCTCDTCCEACGHESTCARYAAKSLPSVAASIANPRPGSFLAWLLTDGGWAS